MIMMVGDLMVVSGHRDTALKLIASHFAKIQNCGSC